MKLLASGPSENSKVAGGANQAVRVVEIDKANVVILEIIETTPRPYLLYHDIVNRDRLALEVEHLATVKPREKVFTIVRQCNFKTFSIHTLLPNKCL